MDRQWKTVVSKFSAIAFGLDKITNWPNFTEKNELWIANSFLLKPMQVKCLESLISGHDVMAVLPTGYGKSMIYHLLPFILPKKSIRNIIVVVAPLSSIIMDQVSSLPHKNIIPKVFQNQEFGEEIKGLFIEKHKNQGEEEEADIINQFLNHDYDMMFSHPESILSTDGRRLLREQIIQQTVVGIVVDDVHCVETW